MNRRTPALLALIILLPILMLGWLGVRLLLDQQQVAAYQLNSLADSQLQSADRQLQQHFTALQSLLIEQAEMLSRDSTNNYDSDRLRRFVSESLQVEQMFVMAGQGQRLFPPRQQPLTRKETDFVNMIKPLLASPERFTSPVMDPVQVNNTEQKVASGRLQSDLAIESLYRAPASFAKAEADSRNQAYGWLAWYAENGLRHIFWWQDNQGNTLGFMLNPARLLSDLINTLPDNQTVADGLEQSEMVLLNDRDEIIYSWGGFQHGTATAALRVLPLSYPLSSWRLNYYNAPQQGASSGWIGFALLLVLVALVLCGLGFYLYREHSRELREAEQRVNFVNQVSHELKTPLTNVRLYAEMLENEPVVSEEPVARGYLEVISSESQRLSRLIDNVLNYARAQRQGLQLHYREGKIDSCIQQVITTFTPVFEARNMEIGFQGNATYSCRFDNENLEQILNNLLSNCEKYAAAGERIEIQSWQESVAGGYISRVSVRDYGPGLTPDQAAKVFEPFYRVSNQLTDGISGTGIGLGLARDLARRHGGDLVVRQPEDQGGGICFLISLKTPGVDGRTVSDKGYS